MADTLVPIFDAPLGVNTVDDPASERFQPGGETKPFLRAADNVDVDRTGGYRRRQGRTKRRDLTDGHSLFSATGRLFYVDAGTLYRYDSSGTDAPLVTELGPDELSAVEVAGQVFWSNGTAVGRLVDGEATFWGLGALGAPTLSATAGGLPAGTYQVVVTQARDGVESGYQQAASITLLSGGTIQVEVFGVDPAADTLHVYCSERDQSTPFWAKSVAPDAAIEIARVGVSTQAADGFGAYPPPPGHLVRAFGGRVLVADGATLYWSEPLAYHRFQLETDFQMFEAPIVLLEPMPDGFYVATEGGLTYWVAGDDPSTWRPRVVSTTPVCQGAAVRVSGRKLPWAQTSEVVAVWATADGWAAGLPSGVVQYPTDGRVALDTYAKATLAYREEDGLRQILMSLRDKAQVSQFGATDIASAVVIKADGTIQ